MSKLYRFQIVRDSIINRNVDVIVNSANSHLLPGGGVCGVIMDAAGENVVEECKELEYCNPGGVCITTPGRLAPRIKAIYHTVGPKWREGKSNEVPLLEMCYSNCIKSALKKEFNSIAFPLISSGIYGMPYSIALNVAVTCILDTLEENEYCVDRLNYIKKHYKTPFKVELCLFKNK